VERGILQRVLYRRCHLREFALGFWLALLLNNHFPFKSLLRAIVLLPWIVPTCCRRWRSGGSTIRSFPSFRTAGGRAAPAHTNVDFLGSPWPRGSR